MSEALIGSDQTEGLGSTDGSQETAEHKGASPDDFNARVMSDGEFALDQIRKRDRHASELANRVKSMEPIENLVKLAGGPDALVQYAQLGSRVQQVPGLMEVVQSAIQNGRVELPQVVQNGQSEDDEWLDPDVKKVRDAMLERFTSLEQKYSELERMASGADVRSKEQRVKENIEKVLSQFDGDPEAHTEASKTIMERYKAALDAAERGDKTQAHLIDQLAATDGVGVLEYITMPIFKKYAAKLVGASNAQTAEAAGGVARRSTDERTVNPSRPGDPPLPKPPKGRVTDGSVQRILEEVARRKGIDPRLL